MTQKTKTSIMLIKAKTATWKQNKAKQALAFQDIPFDHDYFEQGSKLAHISSFRVLEENMKTR